MHFIVKEVNVGVLMVMPVAHLLFDVCGKMKGGV
jgi:hypothetical protein